MDKTPDGSLEPLSDDDETNSSQKTLVFSRAGSASSDEGNISTHETDTLEEDKFQGDDILKNILSRSKQYSFLDFINFQMYLRGPSPLSSALTGTRTKELQH